MICATLTLWAVVFATQRARATATLVCNINDRAMRFDTQGVSYGAGDMMSGPRAELIVHAQRSKDDAGRTLKARGKAACSIG